MQPYGQMVCTPRTHLNITGGLIENLDGDDSRVIMDRAIPFIREAAAQDQPFLAVIWFHTPHLPVVAGPPFDAMYPDASLYERNYYGCMTAMDEQLGRLRKTLDQLGIRDNTMLWFASDNGPEGKAGSAPGSAGPFRGRKRSLYEGGIRVPVLLEWPGHAAAGTRIAAPACTSDYVPTVMHAMGFTYQGQPDPSDDMTLMPLLNGTRTEHQRPIAFESRNQMAIMDDRLKLYSGDKGSCWELYDVHSDPAETRDIADKHPGEVARLRAALDDWRASCKRSLRGEDYRG